MRRRTSPVQQWVDSLPSPIKSNVSVASEPKECQDAQLEEVTTSLMTEPKEIPYSMETKSLTMTVSAPINVPNMSTINTSGLPSSLPHKLVRDPSLQSDSSHCSSVESLLELRKADPEAILLGLGFGGCPSSPQENGSLSRIPKRFLQPSKLKGIAINDFMKHQQETSESFDSVSLGYRGLTGSPYVAPSEIVQKIMQRLREHESHEHDPYVLYNSYEQYSPLQQSGTTLSVLSPDNRQFLERPRSKSPDMRNKRMIIGQKSFAFGHDGDLIEINPADVKVTYENNLTDGLSSIGSSQASRNLENTDINHDQMFQDADIQEVDKMFPRKLLFDDSIELCANVSVPEEIPKEHANTQSKNLGESVDFMEDTLLNTTSLNLYDIRRASDGSCDIKPGENFSMVLGRRHSDSFVPGIQNIHEPVLAQRRRTLKRQTRVSDIDAIDFCNSKTCTSDTVQHRVMDLQENVRLRNEDQSCSTQRSNTLSEEHSDCAQCIGNGLNKENGQQDVSKHRIKKDLSLRRPRTDEEETTTSCCCRRSGSTKYWEKMDKIIQENKNLENMVAKNRREMAEIREMLSSVLSVRLEPGF
ncbi:hypothetical protein WN55_05248 [Dufourea novaeangliae]|uniref:ITPR-interacting domain-containing protein n=2 Tax=Dufourea novaeangliae TaxID=178035 RepID=A0A154PP77_DUFNO|nr:hypothetical protein WN55_05248 [Dufourea novaeangliae]